MNQMNGFESQEKEMEYEILFCHHCDDSLAGHRWVLKQELGSIMSKS